MAAFMNTTIQMTWYLQPLTGPESVKANGKLLFEPIQPIGLQNRNWYDNARQRHPIMKSGT